MFVGYRVEVRVFGDVGDCRGVEWVVRFVGVYGFRASGWGLILG